MRKMIKNLYQIFLIATKELFLFEFFHILKKKVAAEYPKLKAEYLKDLTLFTVYEYLRYVI